MRWHTRNLFGASVLTGSTYTVTVGSGGNGRGAGNISYDGTSSTVDELDTLTAMLWNDAGPEGRQALASALFSKLEVEGYTKMRYQLTPDAAGLGLGAHGQARRASDSDDDLAPRLSAVQQTMSLLDLFK